LAILRQRPSGGMADTRDLKSLGEKSLCGFDPRLGHCFLRRNVLKTLGFRNS
jgi:hypothetical protein